MNVVVTHSKVKTDWLQIRISEQLKEDFRIAAELRGLSSSALIHSFITKTVREEKELSPQSFKKNELVVNGSIERVPDQRVAHVRSIGELTDERKHKPNKRKVAK